MRNRRFHLLLLITCVVQAICIFAQSALAGSFLSGADGAVSAHEVVGWITCGVAVLQLGLLFTRSGSTYGIWMRVSSIGIATALVLQLGTGYGRFLRVHIPLALLIVSALVWQVTWMLRGESSTASLAEERS